MTGGILCLGKGRLSGACRLDEDNVIMLSYGGALYKKRLLENRQIIDEGIISYASDCYVFPFGNLYIDSEVNYEANN